VERPEFWGLNPSIKNIFYILAALSLFFFLIGCYNRLKTWQTGLEGGPGEPGSGSLAGFAWRSFKTLFTSGCLSARRSFRLSRPRAFFLLAVQWSFLILFFGTIMDFLDAHVFPGFLSGRPYLVFKLAYDIAGTVFIVCIAGAIIRRLAVKALPSSGYDYFLLMLMLLVGITSFVMQGIRFNLMYWTDEPFSPLGRLFKILLSGVGSGNYEALYNISWMVHTLLALVLIAYLPYSRMFHIFAAQITTQAAKEREKAAGIR